MCVRESECEYGTVLYDYKLVEEYVLVPPLAIEKNKWLINFSKLEQMIFDWAYTTSIIKIVNQNP